MCCALSARGFGERKKMTCTNVAAGKNEPGIRIHFLSVSNKTFKGRLTDLFLLSKGSQHYCQPGM